LGRFTANDRARQIGCASSFHYPHRLTGNVVSRLRASSASCATTAITGMLTSITVIHRISTPIPPMATLR
jgi:hypothetical protein